jgi:hypothetical protein
MTHQELVAKWESRRVEGQRLRAMVPLDTIASEVLDGLRQLQATADERRLSLEEAAAESGYSPDHLRRLARTGKLPHSRRGRAYVFRAADLPKRAPHVDAPDIGGYDPAADARRVAGLRAHGG